MKTQRGNMEKTFYPIQDLEMLQYHIAAASKKDLPNFREAMDRVINTTMWLSERLRDANDAVVDAYNAMRPGETQDFNAAHKALDNYIADYQERAKND